MEDATSLPIVKSHACPQCGQPVVCGVANGAVCCWCMELERIVPLSDSADALCLCEACLRAKIAAINVTNSLRELEFDSRSESPTQRG